MSFENFKKAVEKELQTGNYTTAEKNNLAWKMQNGLEPYFEDNLTPQETVLALQMGY